MTQLEEIPKEVDLKTLLSMHRRTYRLVTGIGPIVLRHLPKLEGARIASEEARRNPDIKHALIDAEYLASIAAMKGTLTAQQAERWSEVVDLLEPLNERLHCACFVSPIVSTVEELHAIYGGLEGKEMEALQKMLNELATSAPISDASRNFLRVCREFNIPIAEDLTADNITSVQAEAFESALAQEAADITKIIGDAK